MDKVRFIWTEQGIDTSLDGASYQSLDIKAETIQGWIDRYHEALKDRDMPGSCWDPFVELGREIYESLSFRGILSGCKDSPSRPIEFQSKTAETEGAKRFHAVPWEVLHDGEQFLASYGVPIQRRIGQEADITAPGDYGGIDLLFMAASPRDEPALNYQREELAILNATQNKWVHLEIEDSGTLDGLSDRWVSAGDAKQDVVHLSCHGSPTEDTPFLAFEDDYGEMTPVTAEQLLDNLTGSKPRLVFLSACHTAEARQSATPLALDFIRHGVDAVLGWDGSVRDDDATQLESYLYEPLGKAQTVSLATSRARRELLAELQASRQELGTVPKGTDWHLLRLYLGPSGGGALCRGGTRRERPSRDVGHKEFLDREKEVTVASRAAFVGRRREVQDIIREIRAEDGQPILIHGIGHHGKSSLAARICNRLSKSYRPVVVFNAYAPHQIIGRILRHADRQFREQFKESEQTLRRSPEQFGTELADLLRALGQQHQILLVIDDLERILQEPSTETSVVLPKPEHFQMLEQLLETFSEVECGSRLILTSRYRFGLDGSFLDTADMLHEVPLTGFGPHDRRLQLEARLTVAEADRKERKKLTAAKGHEQINWLDLTEKLQAAARGNPGLQDRLTTASIGDPEAGWQACEAVEQFTRDGRHPDSDSAAAEFFDRVLFQQLIDALTESEQALFDIAGLFQVPVPVHILTKAAETAALSDIDSAIDRLTSLGLLEDHRLEQGDEDPVLSLPGLARGFCREVTEPQSTAISASILPLLRGAWCDEDNKPPFNHRGLELAQFAIRAKSEADINDLCPGAIWYLRDTYQYKQGLAMAETAFPLTTFPPIRLFSIAMDCAERLGEAEKLDGFIEQVMARPEDDSVDYASLRLRLGKRLMTKGNLDKSESHFTKAASSFASAKLFKDEAIAHGHLADILEQKGDTEAALNIRYQKQLPVYEQIGDVRSAAIAHGKIADILAQKGDTEAALNIRYQKQLPIFEQIGDVRSAAITHGKIADILVRKGDTEAALNIRYQKELPIYEQIGDVRSAAITHGQIADILEQKGDTEAALNIRYQKQLPIFEQIGDVRSAAITHGQIADILAQKGDTEAALNIRYQKQLPVYEQIGDVRSAAVTQFKIGQLSQMTGQNDQGAEAYAQAMPVFEHLGDAHSLAVGGKIYGVLLCELERPEEGIPLLVRSLGLYKKMGMRREFEELKEMLGLDVARLAELLAEGAEPDAES